MSQLSIAILLDDEVIEAYTTDGIHDSEEIEELEGRVRAWVQANGLSDNIRIGMCS